MNALRSNFEKEIAMLNNDLIVMASLIEESIAKSMVVIRTGDGSLADEIILRDKEINSMEKTIESRCLTLLLRQQPVASDLRLISTALGMITDMERIGDHAKDISEIVKYSAQRQIASLSTHIPQMAAKAIDMVKDSITAFVEKDVQKARETIGKDDEIDRLFDIVKEELTGIMRENVSDIEECLNTFMITKYLERIGDHAVNICEWVIYLVTGVHTDTDDDARTG